MSASGCQILMHFSTNKQEKENEWTSKTCNPIRVGRKLSTQQACVAIYVGTWPWLQRRDSNPWPSGLVINISLALTSSYRCFTIKLIYHEPDELPTAPPRVVAEAGFEPAISNL